MCYNGCVQMFFGVGLLALAAGLAHSQNVTQGPSSPSCGPDFTNLGYPALALAANIMGSATATFDIDTAGGVNRLEFKGHPLLAAGAVEALRSARFDSECWGRSVSMEFNFRLDQDLDPKKPVLVKLPPESSAV
jgi:outer membrane biosynthesis protein TonB